MFRFSFLSLSLCLSSFLSFACLFFILTHSLFHIKHFRFSLFVSHTHTAKTDRAHCSTVTVQWILNVECGSSSNIEKKKVLHSSISMNRNEYFAKIFICYVCSISFGCDLIYWNCWSKVFDKVNMYWRVSSHPKIFIKQQYFLDGTIFKHFRSGTKHSKETWEDNTTGINRGDNFTHYYSVFSFFSLLFWFSLSFFSFVISFRQFQHW